MENGFKYSAQYFILTDEFVDLVEGGDHDCFFDQPSYVQRKKEGVKGYRLSSPEFFADSPKEAREQAEAWLTKRKKQEMFVDPSVNASDDRFLCDVRFDTWLDEWRENPWEDEA